MATTVSNMRDALSRADLKEYCLRRLGHPVIQINVDDDQLEDRIDDALHMFWEYHFDGVVPTYLKHLITSTDITNRYITVSDLIIGVNRILVLPTSNPVSMWNIKYQMFLNDMHNLQSASFAGYVLTQQHLRNIEMMFSGEVPIRFNRMTNILNLDLDWGTNAAAGTIVAGDYVIVECVTLTNPNDYPKVYNDRWVKTYTTTFFKRQWGENLKKFGNIQLPGGTVLNGKEIYDEAIVELDKLETQMLSEYSLPPDFYVG